MEEACSQGTQQPHVNEVDVRVEKREKGENQCVTDNCHHL